MNTSRACFRFRPAYQAASLSGVLQTPSLATSSSFSRLKPQSSTVSFLFNVLFSLDKQQEIEKGNEKILKKLTEIQMGHPSHYKPGVVT